MNISSVAGSYLSEINARVSGRLAEISGRTGLSFPDVFSEALDSSEQVNASTSSASSDAAATAKALLPSLTSNNTEAALLLSNTLLGTSDSASSMESLSQQLMAAYNARTARQQIESATDSGAHESVLPAGIQTGKYDALITEVAAQYGVSPLLVRAIAFNESGFDPNIVSANGATGMMQLMPATIEDFDVGNPLDPRENIDAGVRVLMGHIIRYDGDIKMALAAYNAGPGLLSKRGIEDLSDPEQFAKLPEETRNYITKIENYVKDYGYPDLISANFFGGSSR